MTEPYDLVRRGISDDVDEVVRILYASQLLHDALSTMIHSASQLHALKNVVLVFDFAQAIVTER